MLQENAVDLGYLNKYLLFLIVLETRKSKIGMPEGLMSGESPLLGLNIAAFLLYPHMIEIDRVLISSSNMDTNAIMGTQSPRAHLNLIISQSLTSKCRHI